MKKLKILLGTLIIIAFLAMVIGFMLIMIAALEKNYDLVYAGVGLVLGSTIIYTILIIYGLVYYFKKRRS